MDWLWALLLVVAVLAGWGLTVFSLPGNWVIVVSAALYAWLGPADPSRLALGLGVVLTLAALATLGEIVEFAAGAWGAVKAGASRRAAALALVGSLAGSVLGMFVGLPIPVVGSIVAALLFASLGAAAGAIGGEVWAGKEVDESWGVGGAAFLGRLCGTLGKMLVGSVMTSIALAALALR